MFALMVMSTDMHIHTTVYARKAAAAVSHMIRKKENIALLTYMLQHNEHHAAELDQMADKLRKAEWIQRRNRYGKRLMNSRKATCI